MRSRRAFDCRSHRTIVSSDDSHPNFFCSRKAGPIPFPFVPGFREIPANSTPFPRSNRYYTRNQSFRFVSAGSMRYHRMHPHSSFFLSCLLGRTHARTHASTHDRVCILGLFHTLAIFAGIMIERKSHLILACRTNASVLVLPVAHAFSRCSSHITMLTKTFREFWPLGRRKPGVDNRGQEEHTQDDAKHQNIGSRHRGVGSLSLFPMLRQLLLGFQYLFQQRTCAHCLFWLLLQNQIINHQSINQSINLRQRY